MTKKLKLKYKKRPEEQLSDSMERFYPELKANGQFYKQITFQVTDDCCMACTYCYQHNKDHHSMPFEIAKLFIDKLLNDEYLIINTSNTFGICFDFIGGEPLMNIDLIQKVWEYYLEQTIALNHPWLLHSRFSICSNGLLYFNEKVQNFIKKYHNWGTITFSIDGNKELHDLCRIDLKGNGTYDRAVLAMQHYTKISGRMPSTKMTLSPDNIKYTKDAIVNLIDLGYINIFLNCIFEKGWEYSHATLFYYQLKELTDYLVNNNLYDKVSISIFSEIDFKPMEEADDRNWCGGIVDEHSGMAIDWEGKIFPCLRYMESSLNGKQAPLFIGTVQGGFYQDQEEKNNEKLLSNITRRSQSTDKCFYCPIAKGCAWCSGYCYECNGTPNCRTTYICVMHQARALANCYYWNKVYKKVGINKHFINHVPESWALNIIDKKELEELNNG